MHARSFNDDFAPATVEATFLPLDEPYCAERRLHMKAPLEFGVVIYVILMCKCALLYFFFLCSFSITEHFCIKHDTGKLV